MTRHSYLAVFQQRNAQPTPNTVVGLLFALGLTILVHRPASQLFHRTITLQSWTTTAVKRPSKLILATYFPQFHQFDLNDRLWGPGFTDFTNVARVTHNRHGQPVLHPAAVLGMYDLTHTTIRRMQGDLAAAYGVSGFAMYHYWFDEEAVMDAPLQLMLRDGFPNVTFCLIWANEPWTARWDGDEGSNVLVDQKYDPATWTRHVKWLVPFFKHSNYLRVRGCPVLFVYRAYSISNTKQMTTAWNQFAMSHGLPGIHFVQVLGKTWSDRTHEVRAGMTGTAEHFPNYMETTGPAMNQVLSTQAASKDHMFGVSVAFDNTPRHARALHKATIVLSHPSTFYFWLRQNLARTPPDGAVLVNAWNEWGEGAVLEPSVQWGMRWLEAVRDAVADEARGHVADILEDGFVASVPLLDVGVGRNEAAGAAEKGQEWRSRRLGTTPSRVCIIVRAHQRQQTGMYNLHQLFGSLLKLRHTDWDAYVINSHGAMTLPAMVHPYTMQSQGRIRMAAGRAAADVTRGSDDAMAVVQAALNTHCVPSTYAWAVVARGSDWYAPDAFDFLPRDVDVVLMRGLDRTQSFQKCAPLDSGCDVGRGHVHLGGRVFRTRALGGRNSTALRHLVLQGGGVDTLSSFAVAQHPDTACALYTSTSRRACALVGGMWFDDVNKAGCYYLSTEPWNASRVDYGAFVRSREPCVSHIG